MDGRRRLIDRIKGRLARNREIRAILDEWDKLEATPPEARAANGDGPGDGHDAAPADGSRKQRLFLIPGDPWSVTGSKGDEAMIVALIDRLSARYGGLEVAILTATPGADEAVRKLGYQPFPLWTEDLSLGHAMSQILAFGADMLLVIGGDVMDGYYNVPGSLRFVALVDLAARCGIKKTAILGFSFNRHPHRSLRPAYDRTTPGVLINLRDRQSLERFNRFSTARARLVADVAFMLEPDHRATAVEEASRWVGARHEAGQRVLAFNIHPMLFRRMPAPKLEAFKRSTIAALRSVLRATNVSLLLLCHDVRLRTGDDVCLKDIHAALLDEFGDRVYYPTPGLGAAQLKAIVTHVDAVVTGRMHLAIAALGTGVPVAAMTYQDKFDGLFEHFALPRRLLLHPKQARDPQRLSQFMLSFLGELAPLRDQVRSRLPSVLAASESNLQGIPLVGVHDVGPVLDPLARRRPAAGARPGPRARPARVHQRALPDPADHRHPAVRPRGAVGAGRAGRRR